MADVVCLSSALHFNVGFVVCFTRDVWDHWNSLSVFRKKKFYVKLVLVASVTNRL